MVELIALVTLLLATAAYGGLMRHRAQRRPIEQRLHQLQPLIAPWLNRTGAASR